MLAGTFVPDLFIKREGLAGKVSAHVQQYPVIEPGLPQTSRRMEAFRSIQFDVVIAQDASASRVGWYGSTRGTFLSTRAGRTRKGGWCVPHLQDCRVLWGRGGLDGLCVRKVNESTEIGDSGSGHPLALPHYEQEVIATICS